MALALAQALAMTGCAGRGGGKSAASAPCWFYSPSPDDMIGAIGVSDRQVSIGSPEAYARERAIEGVLQYLRIDKAGIDKEALKAATKGDSDQLAVAGQTLRLAEHSYRRQGLIYAYAALGSQGDLRRQQQACPEKARINPDRCEPRWLCQPATTTLGGIVGVSTVASFPSKQYELAFKNGVILLDYAYGVKVEGVQEFLLTKTSIGIFRTHQNDVAMAKIGRLPTEIRLYVKGLRFYGDRLYLWIVSPDLPPYTGSDDLDWRFKPSQGGRIGAVGESGATARNLLSDQIHRAFAKGAIELAATMNVQVDAELTLYRGTSSLFAQRIRSALDTTVHPVLRGTYLADDGRVYVWVVSE